MVRNDSFVRNRIAVWGEPLCDRYLERGVFGDRQQLLYRAFAERPCTHEFRNTVLGKCTCKNFRSRRGTAINKNHHIKRASENIVSLASIIMFAFIITKHFPYHYFA